MVNVFGPEGIGVSLAGAVLGVFIARSFNVNKLLILAAAVVMTLFIKHPLVQLAGTIAIAIIVSDYVAQEVYQIS